MQDHELDAWRGPATTTQITYATKLQAEAIGNAGEIIEQLTRIATTDLNSMDQAQISAWIDDVKYILGY